MANNKKSNFKKNGYGKKETVYILDCINPGKGEHDYVPDMQHDLEAAGHEVNVIKIDGSEALQCAIKEIGQSNEDINIIINAHGTETHLCHAVGNPFSTYKDAFVKIKRLAKRANTAVRVMMPVCQSSKYFNNSRIPKNLNLTILGFNNDVVDYDATNAVVAFMKNANDISHDYDVFAKISVTKENKNFFDRAVLIDCKAHKKIDGYQYSDRRPENRKAKGGSFRGAETATKPVSWLEQLWHEITVPVRRLLDILRKLMTGTHEDTDRHF